MEIYLRRSSLCSPTEGQAPSKAAVLSEACSPVFAADPCFCKSPSPRLYSSGPSTHQCVVAQRDQGRDIFCNEQFSARRNMKESKQTTCSVSPVFASVCSCVYVCIISQQTVKGSDKYIRLNIIFSRRQTG